MQKRYLDLGCFPVTLWQDAIGAGTTPESDVDNLIKSIADQENLDLKHHLPDFAGPVPAAGGAAAAESQPADDLMARLAALKQ